MINPVPGLRILPAEIEPAVAHSDSSGEEFVDTLRSAMEQVDQLQGTAEQKVSAMLNGTGMDVHGAMIAVEQADLSFQLIMQVRNKIVQAYQEISRMQF